MMLMDYKLVFHLMLIWQSLTGVGLFCSVLKTIFQKASISHIRDGNQYELKAKYGKQIKVRLCKLGFFRCGKTTICQLFAALAGQKFFAVNCHLHMETSDFLGGLRPVRHTGTGQVRCP